MAEIDLKANHMTLTGWRLFGLFWFLMIAFAIFAHLFSGGVVLDSQIVDGLPQLEFRDDRAFRLNDADQRHGWVSVGWGEYYIHRLVGGLQLLAIGASVMLLSIKLLKMKLPQWVSAFRRGLEEGR